MSQRTESIVLVIWILLILALCAHAVEAQRPEDHEELVRMWLSEARWKRAGDHAAQAHIVSRFSTRYGVPLKRAIQLRVWNHANPPRWVRRVNSSCQSPAGYPRRLRWSSVQDDCGALFARAEAFFRGEVRDPCNGRARGWRAPWALQPWHVRVWCGRGMSNVYVR